MFSDAVHSVAIAISAWRLLRPQLRLQLPGPRFLVSGSSAAAGSAVRAASASSGALDAEIVPSGAVMISFPSLSIPVSQVQKVKSANWENGKLGV